MTKIYPEWEVSSSGTCWKHHMITRTEGQCSWFKVFSIRVVELWKLLQYSWFAAPEYILRISSSCSRASTKERSSCDCRPSESSRPISSFSSCLKTQIVSVKGCILSKYYCYYAGITTGNGLHQERCTDSNSFLLRHLGARWSRNHLSSW